MIAENGPDSPYELVLLDVGNTHVSAAAWTAGRRGEVDRAPADPPGGVRALLRRTWDALEGGPRRRVLISSVNPPLLDDVLTFAREAAIAPVLIVGRDIDPPIGADLPDPARVGSDRLCTAAAAYAKFKCACVVADFGTALTIDLVSDNGVFLGGTILPGMRLSAMALHEHTAQLPLVEPGPTDETLGKDTVGAIRNGILAMMAGALREITERYATQIGKWPPLILTGGDAEIVAGVCDFVDRVVPGLCLDGLVLAYQLHVESDAAE